MFKSKFKYVSITLIVVALSLSAFFIINKNKENANAQVDNPIGQVTKPKATTSTTTTISTLPAKLNMTQNLYEGVELTVLNVGPGHWPGTAEPGGYGNTVIAGHRVTHSKPFRNVDQLVVGDDIFVSHNNKIFNYKVSGTEIVYPKDIWIVDQTPGFRLTLFACHPPGSASQRIVIYADLVDPPFDV